MKTTCIALSLLLFATATATFSQTPAQKSFDELKSLTGSWEGTNAQGKPLQVSFRETGAGTALVSEIINPGHDMISVIHFDGPGRLLITHYCSAGNQPRMQASGSPDGKTTTFDYLDATNLASPDAGHMQRVTFTVIDVNHHTEEWTYADHGKEMKELFDLHRSAVAQK
jgi:hypothetical protein